MQDWANMSASARWLNVGLPRGAVGCVCGGAVVECCTDLGT